MFANNNANTAEANSMGEKATENKLNPSLSKYVNRNDGSAAQFSLHWSGRELLFRFSVSTFGEFSNHFRTEGSRAPQTWIERLKWQLLNSPVKLAEPEPSTKRQMDFCVSTPACSHVLKPKPICGSVEEPDGSHGDEYLKGLQIAALIATKLFMNK